MEHQRGNVILEELLIIALLVWFVMIFAWPDIKPMLQGAGLWWPT